MELRRKKNLFYVWTQGKAMPEVYRPVVCLHREKTQKPKAQLELKLASVVSEGLFKAF